MRPPLSFLSPPPLNKKAQSRTPPLSSSLTPYVSDKRPIPFLTPLVAGVRERKLYGPGVEAAFEGFLYNAFIHVEVPSRAKAFAAQGKKTDQDDILMVVDECVEKRIKQYTSKELAEIRGFYRDFSPAIQSMMSCLQDYASNVPDDLVQATVEGFKQVGENPIFNWQDIETYLMVAAGQLNRFNVHFQEILARPRCHNTKTAWVFCMAFLGLAVGVSLHFIPVVGLELAVPMATEWLFLLVNILGPALVAAASCAFSTYVVQSCFFQSPKPEIHSVDEADLALKAGVERLLVQVTRALLIEAKVAEPISAPSFDASLARVAGTIDNVDEVDRGDFVARAAPAAGRA